MSSLVILFIVFFLKALLTESDVLRHGVWVPNNVQKLPLLECIFKYEYLLNALRRVGFLSGHVCARICVHCEDT